MFLWPLDLIFDSGRMILVPFYRQRFRNVVIICINVLPGTYWCTIDDRHGDTQVPEVEDECRSRNQTSSLFPEKELPELNNLSLGHVIPNVIRYYRFPSTCDQ